ncbi:MAG: type II toxin-antitoxin system prevent-host-death family antitoxin, partial [Planctomycetaceae bacterium]
MAIIQAIMVRRLPYTLVYAPAVRQHLQAIEPKHHALIRESIECGLAARRLSYEDRIDRRGQSAVQRLRAFQCGGPVVVTRNGRPVAVLIGVEDEDEIERLLMAYSPRLRSILDESRRQIAEGQGIGHDEFWSNPAPPPRKPRKTRSPKKPAGTKR